jgi:hypothetical protein
MDNVRPRSLTKRILVVIGAVVASLAAAWGAGAFGGTPIQEAAGGALAADATVLAPAVEAFGVWSVIYTAMLAFAVYQGLPWPAVDPRTGSVIWWVLASLILNAAWIGAIQAGWLWLSVFVIVAIVIALGVAASRLAAATARTRLDRVFVDIPVGLYLGWVCVATAANFAAAGSTGFASFVASDGEWVGVVVIALVVALSVGLSRTFAKSSALTLSTATTLAWGLAWIAVGRLTGEPSSQPVGIAAAAASVVVTVMAVVAVAVHQRQSRALEVIR